MSTKRVYWLRYSIQLGLLFAEYADHVSTLFVMNYAKATTPRRYRKVMVDVYHRNR